MHDCADNMNFLTDLQVQCIRYDFTLILVWSFAEAAQYIRTLKAYENRSKTQLTGLSKAITMMEQAAESLSCP